MDLIVQRVSERGIPLIVGTLPSNLSDWPPVYKRLAGSDRRYGRTIWRIQHLLRERRYDAAADAVRAGFASYPEDAMLYFLQGQMQSATGAYRDAWESFVRARNLDPIPYRATSQINSIIRRAATGHAGVHLVDLERAYEEHATNGLVGYDLIADNIHATPLGESITALTILETMSAIGFLPGARTDRDVCCPVDTCLAAIGYPDPASPLRLRAILANAKYAMNTPFLNLDASRMYLLEAMQMGDHVWNVWANLATLSYLEGDDSRGATEMQRARELHPQPFDLDNRALTPYLKEALEISAGHLDCGSP